jgi:predicted nucleotidyltransferase component of viral defense system
VIAKNPMQLKAFIKKKAEENHISAQLVMQNYMMERLLERISLSPYKRNFILKGGFLIAAIVGLDTRATMDLDATMKSFPLTVDVTTGDRITPHEVEYSFKLMFDDRSISILAYNLETIFAEKLETVLSRNIANTRPRDFYDIYILYALRGADCDIVVLRQALNETVSKRGSMTVLAQYGNIVASIRENQQMRGFWERYQKDFDYAKDISFDDACNSILLIMNNISEV